MDSTLGQLFAGIEERLDAIEEHLDEILDLARVEGRLAAREPERDEIYDTEDLNYGYGS